MTHPLGVHVIDARDLYGMSRKHSVSAGSLLKYFSMAGLHLENGGRGGKTKTKNIWGGAVCHRHMKLHALRSILVHFWLLSNYLL